MGTNRYAYSGNDPVNNQDPNGNYCLPCGFELAKWGGAALIALGGYLFSTSDADLNLSNHTGGQVDPDLDIPIHTGGNGASGIWEDPGIVSTPIEGPIGPSILSTPASETSGPTILSTPVHDGDIRITVESSGSYTIDFPDGSRYHGKGGMDRAKTSARQRARQHGYDLGNTTIDWTPAANDRESFKDEDDRIQDDGGVDNPGNHNVRNSPGRRYNEQDRGN